MTTILYFFFPRISNYPAIAGADYLTPRMVVDNATARLIIDNTTEPLILEDIQ